MYSKFIDAGARVLECLLLQCIFVTQSLRTIETDLLLSAVLIRPSAAVQANSNNLQMQK